MKHAKRMVLVPEDVLNHYEQKQKILQSTDMSDVKKQKMYNANMESYLSLRGQKDDQIPTVQIAQDAEQGPVVQKPINANLRLNLLNLGLNFNPRLLCVVQS
jgi:hypothetical protein